MSTYQRTRNPDAADHAVDAYTEKPLIGRPPGEGAEVVRQLADGPMRPKTSQKLVGNIIVEKLTIGKLY
jgi:hypothetical protein